RRQGAARRAARGGGPTRVGRRGVRYPPGVLHQHPDRDAHADPRRASPVRGGAARGHALGAGEGGRADRPLHETAAAARARRLRARGAVAQRADREREEGDRTMTEVRVAVVGVGNCAASLVQGVHYYADADPATRVPGLMHVGFGGYHVRDITFVAAFDVDAKKVGRDLSEAIHASENNTIKIADVPPLSVPVLRGHTLDGLGRFYRETITESDEEPVDVVAVLREARAD